MGSRTAFGEHLEALRKKRDLSKAAFARELRTSWSTVNNWELHGALPDRDHLRAIVAVLKLKPEEKTQLEELVGEGAARVRTDSGPPSEGRHPAKLEELLTRALVPGRHTIVDALLVLNALGEAAFLLSDVENAEGPAQLWLDAAAQLRSLNLKVTAASLAVVVAFRATDQWKPRE